MKKLTTIMAAGLAVLAYHTASAQVGLHVSLNLGGVGVHAVYNQAPVQYVDNAYGDDYYYLPDVEAYYSVPQHCYYYNDGRQWVSAAYLPGRFHDFDWRNARRYEIRGERPFMHHDMYRTRYGGFDQRGGGFADNRFNNRGGFDRPGNNRGFDRPFGGNFDNHDRRYDNGGQFNRDQNRGGFNQPQDNRGGQYQNDQNRGGGNWNNQQPANGGQNNGQFNGGQNRGGDRNNQQPSNNGGQNGGQFNGGQNRGGGMDQQPANDGGQNGGRNGQGGMRSGGMDNHFAANQMGVVRPPRF
ncbi:hypothetical protein [Mucilaginibacter ginkgonis]|uniref:YXWGXW repeat-containing protein n=1 Tax=Mucilaginibacter ginkgonis TaxID=2682091 RepID=A0A6I4HXN1_9SPHI|nr:hypothetical protein [Mucilaginibacter ginkgonis]QQL51126.1 hypothetical protein GO620_006660 [Mucilaginibacter ginkgonis]